MQDKIQCPSCSHAFDVEEAIAGQVQAQLQQEFEKKMATNNRIYQNKLSVFEEEKKAFQLTKSKENEIFKVKLEEKLAAQMAILEKEKLSSLTLEVDSLKKENEDKRKENRALKEKELNLIRQQKEMEERESDLLLQMEKQLLEKSAVIEQKGRQKAIEEFQLKEREYQKQIDDQKKLVQEMKRKQEQGSMQLQGEVQELAIEEWLRTKFPLDEIEEIKKGARGADCLQLVKTYNNPSCGLIYYESKRTKEFQRSWIEKFRNDIREKGAHIGVIITDALPKGVDRMTLIDGIWVCTFEEFKGLSLVLRENIIAISTMATSQENKGEKMAMLYQYLTSNEFKLQIEAIVEGFTQMQTDLLKEKRAMEGHWKKREKQLQKVLLNTNYMYNSFKGIAGNAIPQIQELELDDDLELLEDKAQSTPGVFNLTEEDGKDRKNQNSLFE